MIVLLALFIGSAMAAPGDRPQQDRPVRPRTPIPARPIVRNTRHIPVMMYPSIVMESMPIIMNRNIVVTTYVLRNTGPHTELYTTVIWDQALAEQPESSALIRAHYVNGPREHAHTLHNDAVSYVEQQFGEVSPRNATPVIADEDEEKSPSSSFRPMDRQTLRPEDVVTLEDDEEEKPEENDLPFVVQHMNPHNFIYHSFDPIEELESLEHLFITH